MERNKKIQMAVFAALATSIVLLMGVSCEGLGSKLVANVNPCGTILNCNPVEWDLLTTDYPDWNKDPTCTIPGKCGSIWPPVTSTQPANAT